MYRSSEDCEGEGEGEGVDSVFEGLCRLIFDLHRLGASLLKPRVFIIFHVHTLSPASTIFSKYFP